MILFKFSLLDWLIVAVLVYSVAISWFKGFIREVLALITVLAAVLLAAWFYRGSEAYLKMLSEPKTLLYSLGSL